MLIFREIQALQNIISDFRQRNLSIGFVPTMGALHEGHLKLIHRSKQASDITVCSIFVNPTQFNVPSDLEKYPRLPEKDLALLEEAGCDIVFMPEVETMYPAGNMISHLDLDFGKLATVMEGAQRPGHFDGVAQVVDRLLDLVKPDHLYMGQKDYQQVAIVRELIVQTGRPVQLIMVPTVREPDGLAMSSRNIRLSPEDRIQAAILSQCLRKAQDDLALKPIALIEEAALSLLSTTPHFKPEYFEVVDGVTLQPIEHPHHHKSIVACVACWVGDVRLIDNMILK